METKLNQVNFKFNQKSYLRNVPIPLIKKETYDVNNAEMKTIEWTRETFGDNAAKKCAHDKYSLLIQPIATDVKSCDMTTRFVEWLFFVDDLRDSGKISKFTFSKIKSYYTDKKLTGDKILDKCCTSGESLLNHVMCTDLAIEAMDIFFKWSAIEDSFSKMFFNDLTKDEIQSRSCQLLEKYLEIRVLSSATISCILFQISLDTETSNTYKLKRDIFERLFALCSNLVSIDNDIFSLQKECEEDSISYTKMLLHEGVSPEIAITLANAKRNEIYDQYVAERKKLSGEDKRILDICDKWIVANVEWSLETPRYGQK